MVAWVIATDFGMNGVGFVAVLFQAGVKEATFSSNSRQKLWRLFHCARSATRLGTLDLVEDPSAGKRPVIFHRGDRNTQGVGCFLVGHPYEIAEFDHFGLNRMLLCEVVQYFMNSE